MAHTNHKFPPFSIALHCIVAGNFDDPFPFPFPFPLPFPFPFPPFTVALAIVPVASLCNDCYRQPLVGGEGNDH